MWYGGIAKAFRSWTDERLYRMGLKKRRPAAPEKPAFELRRERERNKREGHGDDR